VETKKYLIFAGGSRAEVTGESGRYYICGGTRFRRGNPAIARVEVQVMPEPERETSDPEPPEEAPVKKKKKGGKSG